MLPPRFWLFLLMPDMLSCKPPPGFGGTSGSWTYAAAANDKVYGKVIHQAGALTANVGGQAVKMPAAYRLAANASRIAAAAVYLHPGVRTAVAVAGWLGDDRR